MLTPAIYIAAMATVYTKGYVMYTVHLMNLIAVLGRGSFVTSKGGCCCGELITIAN